MSALKYADFFGKMKPQLKLFGKEILEKYNTFMFLKSEPRRPIKQQLGQST